MMELHHDFRFTSKETFVVGGWRLRNFAIASAIDVVINLFNIPFRADKTDVYLAADINTAKQTRDDAKEKKIVLEAFCYDIKRGILVLV